MLPLTSLAASLPATVPFVGPEAQERAMGYPFSARLGANENAFGPSPKAIAAMAEGAAEIWRYGDPENHDLREAISAHLGVDGARIGIGEGIDGLLQVIVRLFTTSGTPVVTPHGAYPTFVYHVNGFGGQVITVPYANDFEDIDGLLSAATHSDASLLYLANPDNPMGTWHNASEIERLIERLPPDCVLALDEAYIEFAPDSAVLPAAFEHPRLIRLRTFSKAYGMAGARIGYAITTSEIASAFDRVRNHFGVNRVAQVGALAALADQDHLEGVKRAIMSSNATLGAIATDHGLVPLPSAANFVALDTGRDGEFCKRLTTALATAGVFVRMPGVAPLNRCIRVSSGPPQLMEAFEAALPDAIAAAEAE
ncbi:MAG: pyridoxal phosphate-dependent aminotransferase [Pseudomonadota bacterium]